MKMRSHLFPGICLIGLIATASAQTADNIPALIEQLTAPKVRLRDEAQAALAERTDAQPALEKAAASHPSEEARLRAKRLLKDLSRRLWQVAAEKPAKAAAPDTYIPPETVCSLMDGKRFVTIREGRAAIWDAATFSESIALDAPQQELAGFTSSQRALSVSADGRRIARVQPTGEVIISNAEDGKELAKIPVQSTEVTVQSRAANGTITPRSIKRVQSPTALALSPDGSLLLLSTGSQLTLLTVGTDTTKTVTSRELFPASSVGITVQSLSISGDGRLALAACFFQGATDQMALISLPDFTVKDRIPLPHVPMTTVLNRDGSEALVGLKEGGAVRMAAAAGAPRQTIRCNGMPTAIRYSPDGKSAWIATNKPDSPLRLTALESGEEIWAAPPDIAGCVDIAVLSADAVVTTWSDGALRLYRKRAAVSSETKTPR